jgi:hypothetical protein
MFVKSEKGNSCGPLVIGIEFFSFLPLAEQDGVFLSPYAAQHRSSTRGPSGAKPLHSAPHTLLSAAHLAVPPPPGRALSSWPPEPSSATHAGTITPRVGPLSSNAATSVFLRAGHSLTLSVSSRRPLGHSTSERIKPQWIPVSVAQESSDAPEGRQQRNVLPYLYIYTCTHS